MSWRQKITEIIADVLRFSVRGTFLFSALALALALTYILVKLSFFTVRWLDRIWFAAPW